jgi:hypothetical protein
MFRTAMIGMLCILMSCGPARQPDSARTVAAFEVPLPTALERAEFLTLLRAESAKVGFHVDAATEEELTGTAQAIPQAKMSMHAAVWRGDDDDESMAVIMDQADHIGQIWIMFAKGEKPDVSTRFRNNVMQAVKRRWPGTLSLPIMPTGAIPLHDDLIATPTGYVVKSAAAPNYDLKPGGLSEGVTPSVR